MLVTADFCRMIKPESARGTMDQYLQPVQWILFCESDRDQLLVLLSPFEADRLMVNIRESECVHHYVHAPHTSQRMKPSDDLKPYSTPPLPSNWTPPWTLIDQLNVFAQAGQFYLRDYQSYLRLCHFLGVPTKELSDGTAMRWSFKETEITFSGSPRHSVMALLVIRSRGRPFAQTQMGKIRQGQLLREKDFDRLTSVVSDHSPTAYDRQRPHDNPILASLSDMEYGAQDDAGSSVLLRSYRLEFQFLKQI